MIDRSFHNNTLTFARMTLRMKNKYVTNSLHHTLPLTLSVSLVSMLDIPIQSGLGVRLIASFCIIFLEPIPRPNAPSTTGLCRTLFSVRTFFSTAFGATGNQEKCCSPVTPVLCGALHALAEVSFRLFTSSPSTSADTGSLRAEDLWLHKSGCNMEQRITLFLARCICSISFSLRSLLGVRLKSCLHQPWTVADCLLMLV